MINKIKESYDWLQALIAEYENKYDKPTLEGFSSYLERQKCLEVKHYKQHLGLRKRSKMDG